MPVDDLGMGNPFARQAMMRRPAPRPAPSFSNPVAMPPGIFDAEPGAGNPSVPGAGSMPAPAAHASLLRGLGGGIGGGRMMRPIKQMFRQNGGEDWRSDMRTWMQSDPFQQWMGTRPARPDGGWDDGAARRAAMTGWFNNMPDTPFGPMPDFPGGGGGGFPPPQGGLPSPPGPSAGPPAGMPPAAPPGVPGAPPMGAGGGMPPTMPPSTLRGNQQPPGLMQRLQQMQQQRRMMQMQKMQGLGLPPHVMAMLQQRFGQGGA